jgi:hypothetical protein
LDLLEESVEISKYIELLLKDLPSDEFRDQIRPVLARQFETNEAPIQSPVQQVPTESVSSPKQARSSSKLSKQP